LKLVVVAAEDRTYLVAPENVICHSDQGSRHTSLAFGARCRKAGELHSEVRSAHNSVPAADKVCKAGVFKPYGG